MKRRQPFERLHLLRAIRLARATVSPGALRDVRPFPPAANSPSSRSTSFSPSFTAPQTVVVTPLECQSNPSTQPNA
jgi:hypothetical protein